jgi:UDP-glucose 4-epimerase
VSCAGCDAVIHCAAIVHVKEKDSQKYKTVNTDLTAALAEQAKRDGVRLFVFMSSMSVYGVEGLLNGVTVISKNTPPRPASPYGRSKLAAEELLRRMADENFRVYILRPPMVYGSGAPGNYGRLSRLARWLPVFPKVDNSRSALSIERLCEVVGNIAGSEPAKNVTVLYPRDSKPMCTSTAFASLAQDCGHKAFLSALLGKLVIRLPLGIVKKMFGNLVYADNLPADVSAPAHARTVRAPAQIE